ncbi:MAG: ATP synthase F1 subunit delta [Oscillospiraceae bacterium]|nr:ATP synthase F1 subunit delta [Oscillospiraceae bacterium]MCL2279616.1 ATP synthase F1 subunit delta [Oscillospiraceae bacterium]
MERLSVLYANALFDLAKEKNTTDEFLDQAILVRECLQDEDCQRVLSHPQIPASEKHKFFENAFSGKVHTDLLGFLYLVADKNREVALLPALTKLIATIEQHKGKVTARVVSASPYDDNQAQSLKAMLSRRLDKDVELDMKVDSSVIGGPYIFVDGYHIDWTVKKRLRDLTIHMKEGCSA